jgi:hypothetical protein
LFYRAVSGVSQRWQFKNITKNVLPKKSRQKVFTKQSTKNPKPTFSRFFFIHVFGRLSVRGVQKHHKKISEKNLTSPGLGTFLASEKPTNHVKARRFLFGVPLDFSGGGDSTGCGGGGGGTNAHGPVCCAVRAYQVRRLG